MGRSIKAGIDGKNVSLRDLAKSTAGSSIEAFAPTGGGPLTVMSINLNSRFDIKKEFKTAGLSLLLNGNDLLKQKLSNRSAKLLNELSKAALAAVKTTIPVGYKDSRGRVYQSGKLRSQVSLSASGAGNAKQFQVGSGTVSLTRKVIVESGPHSPLPYPNGFEGSAATLAARLDRGGMNRTMPAQVAQGEFAGDFVSPREGESTAWSGRAIDQFRAKKNGIIQRILGLGKI